MLNSITSFASIKPETDAAEKLSPTMARAIADGAL